VIQGLLSTQPITQLLFGRQRTFFCPSARPVHGSARPAGNERWCAKDRTVRKLPISQSRGRSKEAHPLLPSAASPAFWTLREGSAGRGGSWMLWRARPQRHGGRHATNRSRRRFEIFGGDYYGECSAISGAVSACVRQLVFAALFLSWLGSCRLSQGRARIGPGQHAAIRIRMHMEHHSISSNFMTISRDLLTTM